MKLKVILSVSFSSSPELYAELLNIPARSRAERIRSLATVGIASSKRIPDVRLHDSHYKNNVPEPIKERHEPKPKDNKELMELSSQNGGHQDKQETNEEQKERMKIANRIIKKLSSSL